MYLFLVDQTNIPKEMTTFRQTNINKYRNPNYLLGIEKIEISFSNIENKKGEVSVVINYNK